MRVLLTSRPLPGHATPLLPLTQALVEHGHEVAFASNSAALDGPRRLGVRTFAVGLGEEESRAARRRFPDPPDVPEELPTYYFANAFAGVELAPRAEDLDGVLVDFAPDVLVHELAEFAGPLAAAKAGVPSATHAYGLAVPPHALLAAGEAAAPEWRARGLEPHPRAGAYSALYLDIAPPSLQPGAAAEAPARQGIRPAPRPSREPGERATVYVTFGTVFNRDPGPFKTVLEGIRDEPVDIVVTVGRQTDPAALGPQPDNVDIRQFVPQHELLGRCDLVVTHAGSGTTLGSLAAGVPLLLLPRGADQFRNAAAVTAAGAGLTVVPADFSAATVRAAARRVLEDPSFKAAAEALADEIEAMPEAAEAIPALARLAG